MEYAWNTKKIIIKCKNTAKALLFAIQPKIFVSLISNALPPSASVIHLFFSLWILKLMQRGTRAHGSEEKQSEKKNNHLVGYR